jgi:hypothetical protein
MTRYMLLLYAPDPPDEAARAARWAELPEWDVLVDELRAAAVWVANAALHPPDSATTVRVRGGAAELTDGPHAVTREVLAGYFLLDCPDLDAALAVAARVPLARYGSVEVRPVVEFPA